MTKTIVFTGGGTAGHVMPNLALIPIVEKQGFHTEYIGTKNGIEKEIMAGTDVPYHAISAGKLRRYFSLQNLLDPFKIIAGYAGAKRILKRIRPVAVFSKGGFVTVPVVFAAKRLGIRVVLHESDYTPGLANRLCIPRAFKVCVSFPETLRHIPDGKGVYTGLPIRASLQKGSRKKGLQMCGFSGDNPVLLIMGGSLGAQSLNKHIDHALLELTEQFDVIHIRGEKNLLRGDMPQGYRQFGFIGEPLPDILAAADMMISRAGATAVFEILSLHIPALFVPLPRSASRGDQILNAEHFVESGFSHMIMQEDITHESLLTAVEELYSNRKRLTAAMKKCKQADAAQLVAKILTDG